MEMRFELDTEKNPVAIKQEEHLEFHQTIAEFMIEV